MRNALTASLPLQQHVNESVVCLELGWNPNVSWAGASVLAPEVPSFGELAYFSVSGCRGLGDEGVKALVLRGVMLCPSLQEVYLNDTGVRPDTCRLILKLLAGGSLENLRLIGIDADDHVVDALTVEYGFRISPNIQHLVFAGSHSITDEVRDSLLSLVTNSSIVSLDLTDTGVSVEVAAAVADACEANRHKVDEYHEPMDRYSYNPSRRSEPASTTGPVHNNGETSKT